MNAIIAEGAVYIIFLLRTIAEGDNHCGNPTMIGEAMNAGAGPEWWGWQRCDTDAIAEGDAQCGNPTMSERSREWWGWPRCDTVAIAEGDDNCGNPTMIGEAMNGGAGRDVTPKPSPKAMTTVETPP